VTSYSYDANSRIVAETLSAGNGKTWKYDSLGNKIEERQKALMTDADNNTNDIVESWEYVSGSTLPLAHIDGNGARKEIAYGTGQVVISETLKNYHTYETGAVLADAVTTHAYDNMGRKVSTMNPLGNPTYYTYSGTSVLVSSVINGTGSSSRTTLFTYDSHGNVATQTDAAGGITTYTYDAFDRQTSATSASGVVQQKTYDANNNVLTDKTLVDGVAVGSAYAYDLLDKVTSVVQDQTGSVSSVAVLKAYDANGNIRSETYPDGSQILYARDEFDRVVSATKYGSGYATSQT